jgi:hypothetical protein
VCADVGWLGLPGSNLEEDKCGSRIVERFVFGRHEDLEELEELAVVGPTDNRMVDARRLDPARASYRALWSNAFEVGLKPSFEAVDKLELDIVVMSYAEFGAEFRRRTYDEANRVSAAGALPELNRQGGCA